MLNTKLHYENTVLYNVTMEFIFNLASSLASIVLAATASPAIISCNIPLSCQLTCVGRIQCNTKVVSLLLCTSHLWMVPDKNLIKLDHQFE